MSLSPGTYDTWYERPFGRYADQLEKNLVTKLLPEVNRKLILDVGSGTGKYSIMLAMMGAYVVGVDSQLPMVAVAKERSRNLRLDLEVLLSDAGTLPFRDDVFDLSVSILALCFIRLPRRAVEEMRRTTKQRGGLIVGTLNKWSPYGIGKKIRSLFIESSYRHALFHTPFELMRLVGAEEWHSTIFGLEWMPKWLLGVLYPFDCQLGRIFKPFGTFIATKVVILTPPAKAVINKV